jgi:hypothetical protein
MRSGKKIADYETCEETADHETCKEEDRDEDARDIYREMRQAEFRQGLRDWEEKRVKGVEIYLGVISCSRISKEQSAICRERERDARNLQVPLRIAVKLASWSSVNLFLSSFSHVS